MPNDKNEFQFHLGGYLSPFYAMQNLSFDLKKSNTPLTLRLDLASFFEQISLQKQHNIMSPSEEAVALAKRLALVMQYTSTLDEMLAAALQEAQRSDWIIPVSLHPERQKERGFNQASMFARALFPDHSRIHNNLLLRIKNTAVQATLPRDTRIHNLRGAFIAAPLTASLFKGTSVTLVDDVTTTTATLSAAAYALRLAGAQLVHAIVFARAPLA